MFFWLKLEDKLLHFAGVVDDTKCIVVTRICMSVRDQMPTLLHGPVCLLVVHCLEDSQSVHALHCCGKITRMWNV